jgi:Ubiquitin-activating enzyme E1 four-helix bundle
VTQHKAARVGCTHRSLEACISEPGEFLLSDFSKIDRPGMLHVAFQALDRYRAKAGRCPAPGNRADMKAFCEVFREINGALVRHIAPPPLPPVPVSSLSLRPATSPCVEKVVQATRAQATVQRN